MPGSDYRDLRPPQLVDRASLAWVQRASDLGQSTPGIGVVDFQLATAVAEVAEHEPEDRFVEIGTGRMIGAFAGAENPCCGRRLLEHRDLTRSAAQVVNHDSRAIAKRLAGGVRGDGRFRVGAASYGSKVGGGDCAIEAFDLVLIPMGRMAEHGLAGRWCCCCGCSGDRRS